MRPAFNPALFATNPYVSIAGAAPIAWSSFVEANAGDFDADKLDEIFADLNATGAHPLCVAAMPEVLIMAVTRPAIASFKAADLSLTRLPLPGRRVQFVGKRMRNAA